MNCIAPMSGTVGLACVAGLGLVVNSDVPTWGLVERFGGWAVVIYLVFWLTKRSDRQSEGLITELRKDREMRDRRAAERDRRAAELVTELKDEALVWQKQHEEMLRVAYRTLAEVRGDAESPPREGGLGGNQLIGGG